MEKTLQVLFPDYLFQNMEKPSANIFKVLIINKMMSSDGLGQLEVRENKRFLQRGKNRIHRGLSV